MRKEGKGKLHVEFEKDEIRRGNKKKGGEPIWRGAGGGGREGRWDSRGNGMPKKTSLPKRGKKMKGSNKIA